MQLSEVMKKDIKIIAYLVGTWIIGLVVVYLTGDERLVGLIPVTNYVIYRLEKELKNEGYVRALKK